MNIKKLLMIILLILLLGFIANIYLYQESYHIGMDTVKVNEIVQSVSKQWDHIKEITLPVTEDKLEYVVIDTNENLLAATKNALNKDINSAIHSGDTIVDVPVNGVTAGKIIFRNDTVDHIQQYRENILSVSVVILILYTLILIFYAVYINKAIFQPFSKLKNFAHHVAAGNLDVPLEMDKGNLFGAFTESFDLMREELGKARENERLANKSKKELVASLSHDIKTPVASIKAVSELMYVKTEDENNKKQLEIIGAKADQINLLITNMFNAALEELQELKVTVTEESSLLLYDLVKNADYNNRVTMGTIPECIILADIQRLEQIVDNVISNSYKYANTSIEISAQIIKDNLIMKITDYGAGVDDQELPLLFNKFYRAENAAGKTGAGLGLYISKYLINKMSGNIECNNTMDGFTVSLILSLAGKKN